MNILKLYDKASNAKVNLEKTIVFPMAGNAQTEWQIIIDNANGKWHGQNSPEATVYLGFPIFHNEDQLEGFFFPFFVFEYLLSLTLIKRKCDIRSKI